MDIGMTILITMTISQGIFGILRGDINMVVLKQEMTKIDVEDGQEANDEVEPDAEPEPTYS